MNLKKLLLLALLTLSLSVSAAHRSSPEEAKAFFKDAVNTYTTQGKDNALKLFNQQNGEFSKGDLYVFAVDGNGQYLASGANPELKGTALSKQVDAAGNSVYGKLKEALKTNKDPATFDYVWLNRQTNQIESKTSYVKEIDGVILGVGYYH